MRALRADEVELRIGQIYSTGVTFLLYKNARADMVVLDEEVGPENWQRDHKEIKGNLYCGVGIKSKDSWVWKWDCGTESYTEKEKGEASDSFKRACVNWGIGRELYTAPLIFFKTGTVQENGRYKLSNPKEFYGIYVKELECMELDSKRIITKLVINQKAQRKDSEIYRWEYGNKCLICGRTENLETHHIFFGSNRKNSEKYKDVCTVTLCPFCHRGTTGVHGKNGHELDLMLKEYAQIKFEHKYSHEKFVEVFGRSYL